MDHQRARFKDSSKGSEEKDQHDSSVSINSNSLAFLQVWRGRLSDRIKEDLCKDNKDNKIRSREITCRIDGRFYVSVGQAK